MSTAVAGRGGRGSAMVGAASAVGRQQNIANENDRRSIVGLLVRLVRLV